MRSLVAKAPCDSIDLSFLSRMPVAFSAILSFALSVCLFIAPAFASMSTEAAGTGSIALSEYKLSKKISDAFCEAIGDGLSVKDAMDYGIDQSKWMVLGSLAMDVLIHANAEEHESPALFQHATELIEKRAGKCLNSEQANELHAYMENANSPDSSIDISD